MKNKILLACLVFSLNAWASDSLRVYLIPGLGSDYRIFSKIDFRQLDTVTIQRPVPLRWESLEAYAKRLSLQIDTTKSFALIGVSHGGMLATEIAARLSPQSTILISSAQNRLELPSQYRFQRFIPVYLLFPKDLIKSFSFLMQPLVEPDSKNDKTIFQVMLHAKDPLFLKRSIGMIVRWNRTERTDQVVHIHGNHDRTIPYRNIKADYTIAGGSHMMTLTKADEISKLIHQILKD